MGRLGGGRRVMRSVGGSVGRWSLVDWSVGRWSVVGRAGIRSDECGLRRGGQQVARRWRRRFRAEAGPPLSCHADLSGKQDNRGVGSHLHERVGLITEECGHEELIAAQLERRVLHR